MRVIWRHVDDSPTEEVAPGVRVVYLWDGEFQRRAQVVEITAGAAWPCRGTHVPGPEEVYVLEGVLNDGVRDYPAGSFIHNMAGSSHAPRSAIGCRLFVYYPEG
jgi:anti-sigma factor ChrR (cupin superfamily)